MFDLKDLVARVKAKGIEPAEKTIKAVGGEAVDWVADSLDKGNIVMKFLSPMVRQLKAPLLAEIDKIDGKIGN